MRNSIYYEFAPIISRSSEHSKRVFICKRNPLQKFWLSPSKLVELARFQQGKQRNIQYKASLLAKILGKPYQYATENTFTANALSVGCDNFSFRDGARTARHKRRWCGFHLSVKFGAQKVNDKHHSFIAFKMSEGALNSEYMGKT